METIFPFLCDFSFVGLIFLLNLHNILCDYTTHTKNLPQNNLSGRIGTNGCFFTAVFAGQL